VDEKISAWKLLKRINSSCSSGRERRKSVSGMKRRFNAAAGQGNLEMVKYCVANEVSYQYVDCVCMLLPQEVVSRYSNTYAKKPKRLRDWAALVYCQRKYDKYCAASNGHLHILEYLVERKFDEYDEV